MGISMSIKTERIEVGVEFHCLARDSIPFKEHLILTTFISCAESIFIEIDRNAIGSNCNVIVYQPPNTSASYFMSDFSNVLFIGMEGQP